MLVGLLVWCTLTMHVYIPPQGLPCQNKARLYELAMQKDQAGRHSLPLHQFQWIVHIIGQQLERSPSVIEPLLQARH